MKRIHYLVLKLFKHSIKFFNKIDYLYFGIGIIISISSLFGHIQSKQSGISFDNRNFESNAVYHCPAIFENDSVSRFKIKEIHWKADLITLDTLSLTYYIFWDDEEFRNRIINKVYKLFRIMRYGSHTDIEYVQVVVNPKNNSIYKIEYESPSMKGFIHKKNTFTVVHFSDSVAHCFTKELYHKIPHKNGKVLLKIISWNHLFNFHSLENNFVSNIPSFKIVKLTDETYDKYFLDRRSSPYQ